MIQIEGRNPVWEAVKGKRHIQKIFLKNNASGEVINNIQKEAGKKNIIIKRVSKHRIKNMAQTGNPQGVIAQAEPENLYSPDEIIEYAQKRDETPLILLLDHLKDPHNFGAILRTAYAAGAHGVIYPKDRAADITPVVRKTSAGAIEHIMLAKVANINYTIKKLKNNKIWIAGTALEGNIYYEQNLKLPLGIVIGSEGAGLKRLVRENCDFLLKIPMKDNIDSLNASVASGIILYEVFRQRQG